MGPRSSATELTVADGAQKAMAEVRGHYGTAR
jgi:hypothetical protein